MAGYRSRHGAALAAAVGIALLAASPVSAHMVLTSRANVLAAQAAWGTLDEETLAGNFGVVVLVEVRAGMFELEYEAINATAITCTNGTSTTSDDFPGMSGTVAIGSGDPDTSAIDGRRLSSASASGVVDVATYRVNTCTGASDLLSMRATHVSFDLRAQGRVQRDHDRLRLVDPGSSVETDMIHQAIRQAVGTATIGTTVHAITADMGIIGRVLERIHIVQH
jgi:hypothetical protein